MLSSPDRSRLFGRGVRFLPVLLLASLLVTCTDAPSVPEGMGHGSLQIAPQFSFAGATTSAQEDALAKAFELVNRFRMVIHRLPSNELALDTVLVVTPGQEVYDLRVTVEAESTNEQFSVVITALEGDTELFTAEPVTVTSSPSATGSGTTPVVVTMTYSGPGASAVAVEMDPEEMVLGPGSSGTFTMTVRDESGASVANVPVSWSTGSGAVATVTDGGVATSVGGGVTSVVVTTPTGLSAEASLYVAVGQLAFVRNGHVVVGDAAGTEVEDRTPQAEEAWSPAWGPDGTALYYTDGGMVMKAGAEGSRGEGQWPAVSPDGTKLAMDSYEGTILFTNEDGTASTEGPVGTAAAWTPEGTHLVVGGGSIEKVKANGQDRETLSSVGDLPAVSAAGRVAFLTDEEGITSMGADGSGKTDVLPAGVTSSSRPTWSQDGDLLVYSGSDDLLYIVAADGSADPMALPLGAGIYPAWQPAGPPLTPPTLLVESLDPEQPLEGQIVDIVGSGFDWIIPSNTHVFFPGPEGELEGVVQAVTETVVTVLVPEGVLEGTLRVQTLAGGDATIAFDPTKVYDGDVHINAQADLDEFAAGDYDGIEGSLVVQYASVTNLDGMESLLWVTGDVIITNNTGLTDLDGLSNLLVVWSSMEIGDNDNLQDVDGLVTLEHIGYELGMWGNKSLVSMNAFPVLGDVGYVYLEEPGQRISFPSLESIWGELYLGDLGIASDTSHFAVEVGFPALQCVSEGIWAYQNPRLETLDLSALQAVTWECGGRGEIEPVSSLIPGLPDRSARSNSQRSSESARAAQSARARRLTQRAEERRELGAALEAERAERLTQENLPSEDLPGQAAPTFLEVLQAGPEQGSYNAEYPFLELEGNDALTSVDLSSLTFVEGTFLVWHNPTLTSLDLPALGEVGWDLEILQNDLLDDLQAPLLWQVGERGSGSLVVYYNPVLPTFTFPSLASIDNALVVVQNESLESFALAALEYTGGPGDYYSGGCGYWPWDGGEYSPPQGVVPEPGGYGWVYIEFNDLSGGFDLSSLQYVDWLMINWNEGLTSIPSMPSLPGWIAIEIYYNDALTNLDGLSALTKAWAINLGGNEVLTGISGLANLTEVGQGSLWIESNPALIDLSFPDLTLVEGGFYVYYHANLTSVSAPLLTSVGVAFSESLNLYDNPQMSTASFPSLEAIGGSLYIQITALTNLSGFSELTSDLTWFGIISNPVLTDISGLLGLGDADGVDPIITGGLTITYNELLTDELAWAFRDALEAKDTVGIAVSGVVDIRDNGGGGD